MATESIPEQEMIEELNLYIEKLSTSLTDLYGSVSAQSTKLITLAEMVEKHSGFLSSWSELIREGSKTVDDLKQAQKKKL